MKQRTLKTINRMIKIKRRSLSKSCQELVQNESKLRDLIRVSNLLRQRQEQVLSEQLKTNASLGKQVQSALWCTEIETRLAQQQEKLIDYQAKCVKLRRDVEQQHNEIRTLEKYIGRIRDEMLYEDQAAAASYADDLHLTQRQEGFWK